MKETIEDIACGVVFILVVAAIFWVIFSIPAGAQTNQADSIFGALNAENIVRDSSHVVGTIKVWDAPNWMWENSIITPSTIRGDSLFIDDSTFVLLQRLNKPKFGWITDSITWVAIDTTFAGNLKCEHDWVFGEPDIVEIGSSFSCAVYHPAGQHCDLSGEVREKICRRPGCLRSVIEREKWFQHFVSPPKSEFEILKEKQRAKQ